MPSPEKSLAMGLRAVPAGPDVSGLPADPFDSERYIGNVRDVKPDAIGIDLPKATAQRRLVNDEEVAFGEVGQFVCIEAGEQMAFGRIVEVGLPAQEQAPIDPVLSGERPSISGSGTVALLTSVSLGGDGDLRGIDTLPALGARVYAASPQLVTWIACGTESSEDPRASLSLGHLSVALEQPVRLGARQLFGRHCAVLGTSGAGKSWTVATLVEQAAKCRSKIVLIDATGEFHTLNSRVQHVHMGVGEALPESSLEVSFPHSELVEDDLFALFTPTGDVQGPRMRSAIRSLKLAAILGTDADLVDGMGCIPKAGRSKQEFNSLYSAHAAAIHQPNAAFDIDMLPRQIELECVWPSTTSLQGQRDHTVWGEENINDISMCDSLVSRIQGFLQADEFACLLGSRDTTPLTEALDQFLASDDEAVLRISMKHLSFTLNVREIVANAIGRLLLRRARAGSFEERPLVVVLDEAHQFLNKALGEEHTRYPLDAFDLIAKEGRKHSLTICLATQRPGDIPEGVLSQVGTQIVHRLVNRRDRDAVEQGITHLDQSAARFLPTFAPGEAVIVGVYMSVPLSVQVLEPTAKPDSGGADYDRHWGVASSAESG